MPEKRRKSIGIIGGGISGLSSAYYLQQHGFEVTVYERGTVPGGVACSVRQDDWLVELGPNTIQMHTAELWELIDALGLESEVLEAGLKAGKRFVIREGQPVPLPSSPVSLLSTDLFSANAKFRLLKEPFVGRGSDNESAAAFFERRLGREVVDYALNPFVAGIFAGDPDKLSMKHAFPALYELEQLHGSILRGMMKRTSDKTVKKGLISFQNGIGQLAQTLADRLQGMVRCESNVTRVSGNDGAWKLEIGGKGETEMHDALVVTAPLHRLPSIAFHIEGTENIEKLAGMRYAPVAVVALGFRKDQIRHPLDGFGMLVPAVEPYRILGALFSSSLFPGRAPEGHHLLTCFVGGERRPELAGLGGEELRELVTRDLRFLVGCSGEPVFEYIQRWNRAIPQYEMDHGEYLKAMDRLEEMNRGFYLTGNFRREVSLPGCIKQARETAGRAAMFLES